MGPQRARLPFRSNRHPLYELVHIDARPGFFSSVVEAGFHQRAIRLVAHGQVDAAAIDSQVLAVEPATVPLAAALRVIGTFGPSTIQPVVTASRLPDQLKTAVRDLLLGLGGQREAHSARTQGFIQGFVVINNGDYDDIPAMLAAIYTTPPLGRPPPDAEVAPIHRIHAAVASG